VIRSPKAAVRLTPTGPRVRR